MVKVKVLIDGLVIGLTQHKKGSEFHISEPGANYLVDQGSCEIVPENKKATKKKATKKKASYKTRDLKAE